MKFEHISVMPEEVIDNFNLRPGKVYVDCTLGGAGHSKQILQKTSPDGYLIGIDQDTDAIKNAETALSAYSGRFSLVHDNYINLPLILENMNISGVDGILLDLGISLHQLRAEGRGFSFRSTDPLDMRMNRDNPITAERLINHLEEKKLVEIFFKYGEEKFSRRIASRIIAERSKKEIKTCMELADIIQSVIPAKVKAKKRTHPATKVFQALRIAVNEELTVLENFLDTAFDLLNKDGVISVITFHSLEDRIVKHKIRTLEKGCICPPDFPICICQGKPVVKSLRKKPLLPGKKEIENNPMSRSAKLRIATKL